METFKQARADARLTPAGEPQLEIWLSGEIDLDRRDDLDRLVQQFENSHATDVVVHCEHVTFMSAIGISALCRLLSLARDRHGRLKLDRAGSSVRRTVGLAGLDTLILMT